MKDWRKKAIQQSKRLKNWKSLGKHRHIVKTGFVYRSLDDLDCYRCFGRIKPKEPFLLHGFGQPLCMQCVQYARKAASSVLPKKRQRWERRYSRK